MQAAADFISQCHARLLGNYDRRNRKSRVVETRLQCLQQKRGVRLNGGAGEPIANDEREIEWSAATRQPRRIVPGESSTEIGSMKICRAVARGAVNPDRVKSQRSTGLFD
jgi:hypothetical protein